MSSVSKKRHLACFLSFVFLVAASVAQDAARPVSDETEIFLDGTAAGDQPSAENGESAAKESEPSSVWILVRIVLVLALVCAGIYGVVYLLKKSSGGNAGGDPYLKNVASLYFSPNKSVQVVTLGDRAFMVGVTDQAINLLAEVSDRELVDAMNLNSDKRNPIPRGTFQNLLASFFPAAKSPAASGQGGGAGDEPGFARGESGLDASFGGAELIRSRRERLRSAGQGAGGDGQGPSKEGPTGRGDA